MYSTSKRAEEEEIKRQSRWQNGKELLKQEIRVFSPAFTPGER